MNISSPSFPNNQPIPGKYGYRKENVNPPLEIGGIPVNAASLVIVVDDPDAPIPRPPWIHWTAWNIDPGTARIDEGSLPRGAVEGTTSFGDTGYGGPAPPSGTHRYFFKTFALDTELNLPAGSSVDELYGAMEGHVLDEAETIGLYSA
ncbi:MAG: YbhB/YbcL family Raf kinase inhibitor-like protein [Actinomycetota bacterium]|nr:YbhB/YbcL family Raf kinase inhibitor-like protein [Actinomycetota bacterium]